MMFSLANALFFKLVLYFLVILQNKADINLNNIILNYFRNSLSIDKKKQENQN